MIYASLYVSLVMANVVTFAIFHNPVNLIGVALITLLWWRP